MIKNLNLLPEMITSGFITPEEGLKELAAFICVNYRIFGLQKYDEDFRSEIIVSLLERGKKFFLSYKPENGDFFSYIYCFIKGQIKTNTKKQAKKIIDERLSYQEAVSTYNEKCCKYNELTQNEMFIAKVPYNYRKISVEELQQGLKQCKLEKYDRSLFFLAIKASYYLDDIQIQKIANIYEIDVNLLYDLIQFLREEISSKKERLNQYLEKRNLKYYRHKKYTEEIEYLNKNENANNTIKKLILEKKDNVQLHDLQNANQKFEEGYIYLRPPTRIIAEICNISERQINYYLHCIKNKKLDAELLKRIKESD